MKRPTLWHRPKQHQWLTEAEVQQEVRRLRRPERNYWRLVAAVLIVAVAVAAPFIYVQRRSTPKLAPPDASFATAWVKSRLIDRITCPRRTSRTFGADPCRVRATLGRRHLRIALPLRPLDCTRAYLKVSFGAPTVSPAEASDRPVCASYGLSKSGLVYPEGALGRPDPRTGTESR